MSDEIKYMDDATLCKKFLLLFARKRVRHVGEVIETEIVYKMLFGSVYIIQWGPLPPKHINCRCAPISVKHGAS